MTTLITLGQILDNTWDMYRKHFSVFMRITSWLFLVTLLSMLATILSPVGNTQFLIEQNLLNLSQMVGLGLTVISATIATGIISIWIFLTLVKTIHTLQTTKVLNKKEISANSFKVFVPYLWMSFVRGLLFLLPVIALLPGMGLLVLSLTMPNGSAFTAFSILLSIVGMITALIFLVIVWVWFAFPGYAMVIDGAKPIPSLKASRALVQHRFFPVLWRLLLPKIIFTGFIILVQITLFFLFTFVLSQLTTLSTETLFRITDIVGNIVATGITVLVLPLFVLADYFIFDSLKKS